MEYPAAFPQRYSPAAPRRVLLVEDDPEMRALMALTLRGDGHDVSEAQDGAEALDVLGTSSPDGRAHIDLVISDVRMPGCSGLEVLERLRSGPSGIPVILVTAFSDRQTHAEARRLGAVVLDKPFDLGELRAMVLDVLQAH
jgi:DNA-binding response OmpR family regulator